MLSTAAVMAFLPSSDLERSKHFFVDQLGLNLESQDSFACAFRIGSALLRVTKVNELAAQPFTVFGWEVDDVHAEIASLAAQGVAMLDIDGLDQSDDRVWTTPNGDQVAWFNDPDGNTLSLTQFR